MKTPLFDRLERRIIKDDPKSIFAVRYEIALAKRNFAKEFIKTFYIKEVLDWSAKQLNK